MTQKTDFQLKTQSNLNKSQLCLKIGTLAIFMGWAWQFIFFEGPLRALFWDEGFMKWTIENIFKINWYEWGTSPKYDKLIVLITRVIGFIFLTSALATSIKWKYRNLFIYISSFILLLICLLLYKDSNYYLGQLIELTIQVVTPMLFLLSITAFNKTHFLLLISFAISFTFIGHGMYAIGIYPQPGTYIDLVISFFHVSESTARLMIFIFGIIDFIIAFGIYIPKIRKYILFYAAFWGFATAFSRVYTHIDFYDFWFSLKHSIHTTVYRLAHGFIPMAAFYLTLFKLKNSKN